LSSSRIDTDQSEMQAVEESTYMVALAEVPTYNPKPDAFLLFIFLFAIEPHRAHRNADYLFLLPQVFYFHSLLNISVETN